MVRKVLIAVSVAAFVAAAAPAMAGGCNGCDKLARGSEGWCCGKGKAFGVELASKKLYTALAGHEADSEKVRCPGCKTALKTSGKCAHCKVAQSAPWVRPGHCCGTMERLPVGWKTPKRHQTPISVVFGKNRTHASKRKSLRRRSLRDWAIQDLNL